MRIGLLCPTLAGHMNPTLSLGRVLAERGHDAVYIGKLDGEAAARARGLGFAAVGRDRFPPGNVRELHRTLGEHDGVSAIRIAVRHSRAFADSVLQEGPSLVRDLRLDGLAVDQAMPVGGTLAEAMGLPYVTLCNALPLNQEPGVPPICTPWHTGASLPARIRNRLGHKLVSQASAPVYRLLNSYRRAWGLRRLRGPSDLDSGLAQIAQIPEWFDLPRERLPEHFHYAGPFHAESWFDDSEFPYDRLDGRPLVYASLGTLQSSRRTVYDLIVRAFQGLDAQLVLTVGSEGREPADAPESAIVVHRAPQVELLRRARLVIHHAGMNTTLEAMAAGVPMVTIPLAFDQPGIAMRASRLGIARRLSPRRLSVEALRDAIGELLANPSYQQRSHEVCRNMDPAESGRYAAAVVERALEIGRPVTREAFQAE